MTVPDPLPDSFGDGFASKRAGSRPDCTPPGNVRIYEVLSVISMAEDRDGVCPVTISLWGCWTTRGLQKSARAHDAQVGESEDGACLGVDGQKDG